MRRCKLVMLSILLLGGSLLLSGCWDRVEIDERGFVTGVAIDMAVKEEEQGESESAEQEYLGTYQIVVPAGLRSGGSNSASGGKAYFNISTTERSIMALNAKMSTKMSRTPYFEHLKIIVLSQDVVKNKHEDLGDILDFFLRDNEMRRDIKILISDGKAQQLLNIKPQNEKYPIAYMESTLENSIKSNFMRPPSRIGDIHEQLLQNVSFPMQKISLYAEGISLVGTAVFGNDNGFIGFLNGQQTQGLNFMTGNVKGGVVETELDDQIIDFEVERATKKIKAYPDGDNFRFIITVHAEGAIGKSIRNLDVAKSETIEKMEKLFEDKITASCIGTIQVLQKKYKKDVIGLGRNIEQNHYRRWKRIENNWDMGDNLFSQAKIEVRSKVDIRRLGNINQSERK